MIDENGFEIQPLYQYIELFNFLNFDVNIQSKLALTKIESLLHNYSTILKQKYLDGVILDTKTNSFPPKARILYSNIHYSKEQDSFMFEYQFYVNEYEELEETIVTKKILTEFGKHSDTVSFSELIKANVLKFNHSIIDVLHRKIKKIDIKRSIVESYKNELLKTIQLLLSKPKIKVIERYPIIFETLQKLKSDLENIDLNLYTFKSDIEISAPTEKIDSEEENYISSSASKLSWNKAPHLFYLLFSALYEKGFISNPKGKVYLKSVSNLLYQSISLKQIIGNTEEEVEFETFYQNLKTSSNLQEEPLNKDIKALIIKCLEEIEKK